jgi:hypothetical protein
MSPSPNIQAAQLLSLKPATSCNSVQLHKFRTFCTLHFSRHIQCEVHKPHLPYHVSLYLTMIMSIHFKCQRKLLKYLITFTFFMFVQCKIKSVFETFTFFEISIQIWQRRIENPRIHLLYIQRNWTACLRINHYNKLNCISQNISLQ